MPLFNVTYEIVTHESAEHGEAEEMGFVAEGVSLREAVDHVSNCAHEADCYPVHAPRWFTNYDYNENFQTGARESRSLHMPDNLSEASRQRIRRLLGVR